MVEAHHTTAVDWQSSWPAEEGESIDLKNKIKKKVQLVFKMSLISDNIK